MNADVKLSNKYELPHGRVYTTGTQALVRLLLVQKARDEAAGLNTSGFVSGYCGSPFGAVDQELWKARKYLADSHITFQPGLIGLPVSTMPASRRACRTRANMPLSPR